MYRDRILHWLAHADRVSGAVAAGGSTYEQQALFVVRLAGIVSDLRNDVRQTVVAQVHGVSRAAAPIPAADDALVHALKQLIDQQWFEDVKLEVFARTHKLSRFAISRRFKIALGRSPRQYLQETPSTRPSASSSRPHRQ